MKKIKPCFLVVCICFLVFGCASIPEPKTESDILVVGIITRVYENYIGTSGLLNGTQKMGIEITIVNTGTNAEYKVQSQKNGLFYIESLPEGNYLLQQFYAIVHSGSSWASDAVRTSLRFSVENGKVHNLGVINWNRNATDGRHTILRNQEHDDVITEFNSQYPRSGWLQREITITGLR